MKHSAEFKAFDNLVGKLLTVSHEEMQRRESEYRKQVEENPTRRGPKRKVKPSASGHASADPAHYVLHSKPDAVKHKPRRLLCYPKVAVNLPGRNAVFATSDLPHDRKPFVQTDWAVLKDRSGFDAELCFWVPCLALPEAARGNKRNIRTATGRALYTLRPPSFREVIEAVVRIREIRNRFDKCLRFSVLRFHEPIIGFSV